MVWFSCTLMLMGYPVAGAKDQPDCIPLGSERMRAASPRIV
jgi:hypothetical protein